MSATVLEVVGALLGCGGAAAALLLRSPAARYAAIGVALTAALALIAGDVWDQRRFEDLRSQPGPLVLAAVLAGTALAAAGAFFVHNPGFVAIGAFAVIALRLPVQVGSETNFLLVPLYGVIAGAYARAVWLLARGRGAELQTRSSPSRDDPLTVRWLCLGLATSLIVYALGVAWSEDPRNGIITVTFFLIPFAVLFALLRDVRWYRRLVGYVLLAVAAVAAVFAVVALWQYATRELLLNRELEDANELHMYFRVNAVFRDPNVFGRFLALAIVGITGWVAWRRSSRDALGGAAVAAALVAALALTFSQTSFAALTAGLGALLWLRLGPRGLVGGIAMTAAAAGAFLALGGPPTSSIDHERDDLAERSSGRAGLISGGIDLFQDAPVAGQGSGAFAVAYRREVERTRKPVSHTEPITVAAEHGVIGLIPYSVVVIASLLVLLRPWPAADPARAAVAAAYVALLVHSLGYAAFSIDPATWALLALGVALRE